jgi:polysaccharide export outer membrane protein
MQALAVLEKCGLFLCLLFLTITPTWARPFTVQPGDVLHITVWKEDSLDRETIVLPDGTISFPLIGTVNAQGLTPAILQNNIREDLYKYIPDAAVTVMVKAPLGHTINVLGQVKKPGELVMQSDLSVLQALSQAGGLTPYAAHDKIVVIRTESGQKTSFSIPYDDIAQGDKLEQDIDLQVGDVIIVPTSGLF